MNNSKNLTPVGNRIIRKTMRPVIRGVFHLLGHVEISGKENVPTDGAYLILFNHVSIFDPPFVAAFWKDPPEALGAEEIWQRPGQNILAILYGGIPIHRAGIDREALHRVVAHLRSGQPVMMAPEGTRSHVPGMGIGKQGVVYIIEKAGVPIVPVGVVGTTDDFIQKSIKGKHPVLKMEIGKPFRLPQWEEEGVPPKFIRQWQIDQVMLHIADLLPEAYRGIYADATMYVRPQQEAA